jgi:hypothetical protein
MLWQGTALAVPKSGPLNRRRRCGATGNSQDPAAPRFPLCCHPSEVCATHVAPSRGTCCWTQPSNTIVIPSAAVIQAQRGISRGSPRARQRVAQPSAYLAEAGRYPSEAEAFRERSATKLESNQKQCGCSCRPERSGVSRSRPTPNEGSMHSDCFGRARL